MAYNQRDKKPGGWKGRSKFGENRGWKPRYSEGRPSGASVHQAICDQCQKECDVPFKPTGSKPVLCRDCFRKEGGPRQSGGGMYGRRDDRRTSGGFDRGNSKANDQFKMINAKLDAIIDALATQGILPQGPDQKPTKKRLWGRK